MTEVMLQHNTMLETKITELKAKDPDRMINISEVIPVKDTKLRKKFIKQIEKFEKSLIDHMDH
ncbi:5140_t:CDS:1, partial [Funneliformis caledonium]